jgi:hypothetical protein
MMAQHKWHKEIKAWADGAELQYKHTAYHSDWKDEDSLGGLSPDFIREGYEFRIKPREYTYYTKVKITPKSQGIVNTEFDEMASYHSDGDNLKLTFDNRGTLIGVEVIGDDYESN